MSKVLRIVYMGTPEFAVYGLQALVKAGYDIAAVVTAPDKPAGRGRKLRFPDVKEAALEMNIPILQPVSLKDPAFLEELRSFNANLQVVVAFRMLPEVVWNMPELGTINLHASLLPQYRGAAPINHAIINGETATGLTTFFLSHEIDTGNIILREPVPILPEDDAGSLHDKLAITGGQVLVKTLDLIESDRVHALRQDSLIGEGEILRTAPKIFRDDCLIRWDQPSVIIHNLIRGLSPVPAAFTVLSNPAGEELVLKIYRAGLKASGNCLPGTIETDGKSFLGIHACDGIIFPELLQIEGKRKMMTDEFLRGFRFDQGWKIARGGLIHEGLQSKSS